MDFWKLMDILHKYQEIMNPLTEEKLDKLVDLLRLEPGSSVLDIACGKGTLLVKLVEKYGIKGVGIDKSPYCIDDCNQNKSTRVPDADLTFHLMDGADYKPEIKYDLSCCLGGSWVFKDHRGTLEALSGMTKPGGLILVGEPHWLKEPAKEYLEAEEMTRDSYRLHAENVMIGERLGLRCLYTLDSDHDGWDHYETLHWWATEDYIRDNPGDPDVPEIREANEKFKQIYLRWGRDTMGWCIYLFRNQYYFSRGFIVTWNK
ncbi:class I SAM-dependent methyltransferase [Candidatus Bathyarchaeota archaeon]|nr:class I SAM-dependent methyltransferase [Candidatus Bathyarchaeota archaeon]